MKRYRKILLVIGFLGLLLLLTGCTQALQELTGTSSQESPTGIVGPSSTQDSQVISGQFIAQVKAGFNPGKVADEIAQKHKGQVLQVYTTVIRGFAIQNVKIGHLQVDRRLFSIEPDRTVQAIGETLPWGVDRIDADVVHDYPNKGSSDTDVAIVDTGIDYSHPDLNDNYAGGHDYVNDDDDPMDDNGHGTHCSGIVAAEDNTEGVIGVAPEADLYGVKVLDSGGSGSVSDVIAGIEWAVEGPDRTEGNGDDAEVVSMSLGAKQGSKALKDAVDYAYNHGTLPVAAAGNEGNPPGKGDNVLYPADMVL